MSIFLLAHCRENYVVYRSSLYFLSHCFALVSTEFCCKLLLTKNLLLSSKGLLASKAVVADGAEKKEGNKETAPVLEQV